MTATFKDDGFSGFKEITRDGFGELIAAIQAGAVDVVIVRDIDRLTRNLTDWNAFEKCGAAWRAAVGLYRWGPGPVHRRGADYGGMETLRWWRKGRVRARGSGKPRIARRARAGWLAAGSGGSGIPALRQSGRAESEEAAHRAGGNQPGRGGRDPGRGPAGAGARRNGRVDRAGLDRAGDQAGGGEAVVADVDCRHADLGAAGGPARMAGQEVPGYAMAGDYRRGHS